MNMKTTVTTEGQKTRSGLRLTCDHHRHGHDTLVVVTHGITRHRRLPGLVHLAEHLGRWCDVLVYDKRGHGDSQGRFTFGLHEWRDLSDLVEFYRDGYRKVAGIGFSFGGFHTCVAAAKSACFDAVVLVSSLARLWLLDHNFVRPGPFWQERRFKQRRARTRFRPGLALGRRLTPAQCVHEIAVPIQLIHGDRDWLIHPKHSRLLAHRATSECELTVIAGGLHAEFLIEQMPQRFLPLVDAWLRRQLGREICT